MLLIGYLGCFGYISLTFAAQSAFSAQIAAKTPQNASLSDEIVNKLVNSIELIENSKKYPYGIKSIDTKGNWAVSRRICQNTVKNTYARYLKTEKKISYLEFLSRRYCPVAGDKTGLNKNWLNNLKKVSGLDF